MGSAPLRSHVGQSGSAARRISSDDPGLSLCDLPLEITSNKCWPLGAGPPWNTRFLQDFKNTPSPSPQNLSSISCCLEAPKALGHCFFRRSIPIKNSVFSMTLPHEALLCPL